MVMSTHDAPRLVDIGGRRLAMRDVGSGAPPVVLEMGLGAAGSFYDAVAEQLATHARTIWYDRAGLGQSDPAHTPRTIADLVADLHAMLRGSHIPGPYVLVGHSLGGLTVRLYRERYPDEVAALVLIDSAHEDQRERQLAALPPQRADEPSALAQLRHALAVSWNDLHSNDERVDNLANTALMRACGTLDALPLVVISRGRPDRDLALFPPGVVDDLERVWHALQSELAQLSTDSRHIRAERSGHLVNRDQPELLVDEIARLMLRVRAKQEA